MKLRDIKDDYGTAFYFVGETGGAFIPYLITTGDFDVDMVTLKAGAPAHFNDDGTDYHILNNEVVIISLSYIQDGHTQT